MATAPDLEIERKFLVHRHLLPPLIDGISIVQGYLTSATSASIRVRLMPSVGTYLLTVKGPPENGIRIEQEQLIGELTAELMLDACGRCVIEKTRFLITSERDYKPWVIDVFGGSNDGLVLAEIELAAVNEEFDQPDWVDVEVTGDRRYYNEYLARHPSRRDN